MAVVTSLMAKINLAVDETTFKVTMMTSSVAKIPFVVTDITFQWLTSVC